jgi:hypothetical protein
MRRACICASWSKKSAVETPAAPPQFFTLVRPDFRLRIWLIDLRGKSIDPIQCQALNKLGRAQIAQKLQKVIPQKIP